jgi:hypothetical protein
MPREGFERSTLFQLIVVRIVVLIRHALRRVCQHAVDDKAKSKPSHDRRSGSPDIVWSKEGHSMIAQGVLVTLSAERVA